MGMSGILMSSDELEAIPVFAKNSLEASSVILQAPTPTAYILALSVELLSVCVPQTTSTSTARRI